MAQYPGFVGSTAQVRSRNHNAERTINYYVEFAPGTPKVRNRLQPTPGLTPFVVLAEGPIRASFYQDGRMFVVAGASFYEIFPSRTATLRGTAEADGKPATISSNGPGGNQLFIVSGGLGYIYDLTTNVISPISDPGFITPVTMGAFSDGYFLALQPTLNQFQISALYDGFVWDALDVFQISTVSDRVQAMLESHREIWLFGSQTSSVWANVGDADNPFQPIGGVKILQGIGAPFSALVLDNTPYWLGQNEHGAREVFRAEGYSPKAISNPAVSFALNQYPRVDDAIGWGYQDEGHTYYVLYLPSAPDRSKYDHTTWVYDVTTQEWHERALWNDTWVKWEPHLGRTHVYAWGKHLVGDRSSGAIYEMRLDLAADYQVQVA